VKSGIQTTEEDAGTLLSKSNLRFSDLTIDFSLAETGFTARFLRLTLTVYRRTLNNLVHG
jgi:hypothetical protein